ncbi:MAG TPA: alpha/beta fold hydrolase [Gemmatimonadaceae bacterium]|nr:alpha/beta fold hydrolase [Gemmatimonadaceae bacterium]
MKVRAGGIDIGYDDVGDGTPLVLLHAFPLNRRMWAPQLRGLVGCARCIVPDIRGFGESTAAPPYSMDRYADDTVALLDALQVDRAVIGGLSMGGYVALAVWRRHRDRVAGLLLADTRADADDAAARERRRQFIRVAHERGGPAVGDLILRQLVGPTTRAKQPQVVAEVRAILATAGAEGVAGAASAMMERADSTGMLETIDVPTLIVLGAEDDVTPLACATRMHEAIAGSRLEEIPAAGHLSSLERPAAFNRVVSELLSEVAA